MIRAMFLCLLALLALPAQAQEPDLPDVTLFRDLEQIDLTDPPSLAVQRTIAAAEDNNFFDRFPSFSPITRGVVRNFLLTGNERSMTRVAMETQLAIDLANAFTHEEIITIYAQSIYLGHRCYGFDDAFPHMIGVAPDTASQADAVTLALLLKAPSYFIANPARYEHVVAQGEAAGLWSEEEATALRQAGAITIRDTNCPLD